MAARQSKAKFPEARSITKALDIVQEAHHHWAVAGGEEEDIKDMVDSVLSFLVLHLRRRGIGDSTVVRAHQHAAGAPKKTVAIRRSADRVEG